MLRVRLAWVLAALLVLGATAACWPVAAQDEALQPGQGEVLVRLQTSRTAHAALPYLFFSLTWNVSVSEDGSGSSVRAPLPADTQLDDLFLVADAAHGAPSLGTEEDDAGRWAVARWDQEGPAPGSQVTARVEARRLVNPDTDLQVIWDRLPQELLAVRIQLPHTHVPVVDPAYALQREAQQTGLVGWSLGEPPGGMLAFSIRPTTKGVDPALAAPPVAWGAYAVIVVLAALSGGVWLLGKKLDARKERRERDAPRP